MKDETGAPSAANVIRLARALDLPLNEVFRRAGIDTALSSPTSRKAGFLEFEVQYGLPDGPSTRSAPSSPRERTEGRHP